MSDIKTNWQDYLVQFGMAAPLVGLISWAAPKIASGVKTWWQLKQGGTDLAGQLQSGTRDVVTMLREQLADAEARMKDLDTKMTELRQTMDKLLEERNEAFRAKATAENDAFVANLRIKRLEKQLVDAGQTPVP